MSAQVIDYRGLVDLDKRIIDQLESYLKEKEDRLSQQILNVIPLTPAEASTPSLPEGFSIKLSEAVEGFMRKARLALQKEDAFDQAFVERLIKQLNTVFWDYTEALESCVIELFQQVKQVNIDKWHLSIAEVVHHIQDILMHRIEDLIWTIRRLEEPLKLFCQKYQDKNIPFWKKWNQSYLDPGLLKHLNQSHTYLKNQYNDFNQRYNEFLRLSYKIEESLEKMKVYPILALLDISEQNLYVDVYRLLKLIELNPNPKSGLHQDAVRSLKYLSSFDSILRVFRVYYRELQKALFSSSLEFKSLYREKDSPYFEESFNRLKQKVQDYQEENEQLMSSINKYREFILKNDSNPYVSSRWGFTERTVGPEPISASKLLELSYRTEELNNHFKHFSEALNVNQENFQQKERGIRLEIDKLLHEMGQPLISHTMMQNRAQRLLEELKACDELGNPSTSAVTYVEEVLSKAMREDWKYHVLHEFPLFHEIYRLHLGMCPRFEDPAHVFRSERFHMFFDQIEEWVKKGDLFTHIHEIELDINDMKTYLQDFLATVQRAIRERLHDPFLEEAIQKYRQQLLEYRYMFGQFFSSIMRGGADGQQLRIQFLFVDQYFETIENLLSEHKVIWDI